MDLVHAKPSRALSSPAEPCQAQPTLAGHGRPILHRKRRRLSGNATLCGTPGYIAPEVHESQEVDERSDMFSWGWCWYNMVLTRNDFADDSRTVGDGTPCL